MAKAKSFSVLEMSPLSAHSHKLLVLILQQPFESDQSCCWECDQTDWTDWNGIWKGMACHPGQFASVVEG
jgi:hypothetical protein